MPQNQNGQNTLLVPTIQWFEGKSAVDIHFKLEGGNRNLGTLISLVMGVNENKLVEWTASWHTYFCILWSIYETKIDLGLEENLSSLEQAHIRCFMMYSKIGENWHTNKMYQTSRFSLSPHSFYGLLGKTKSLPTIRQQRRKSIKHFQQYIGVGYKDKGAAKVESEDGTPRWQNVASKGVNNSQEANALSRNIRGEVIEPDIITLVLRRSRTLFDPPKKANFQRIYFNKDFIGYKLKVDPLARFCGYATELDEEEAYILQRELKTRITDGRFFYF